MFISELVAHIWHNVHVMNSTAAIFDLITLEVVKKNATQTFLITITN